MSFKSISEPTATALTPEFETTSQGRNPMSKSFPRVNLHLKACEVLYMGYNSASRPLADYEVVGLGKLMWTELNYSLI